MTELEKVLAVIQGYFDALYHGDVEKFRTVFHPQAQLFTAEGGATEALDFESYMKRVAGRPAPAATQDPRFDEILSVTIASPTTAHARVKDALAPNRFIDEFLLVKFGAEWKIVSKAWAYNNVARAG